MIKRFLNLLLHPSQLFLSLGHRYVFNWIHDETYLKIAYKCKTGKRLNIENPITFNEKLQWLKLNDRNPLYTKLVDKYEVRKFVADRIGEEYLIPLLGVWDKFEDIDFNLLPNQFVIKCTHDSGGLVIFKNKDKLNINTIKRKIDGYLRHNYYWGQREWPYKNVKPRIIAEKFMVDESGYELKDYKFFCFHGEIKVMFVASNRGIGTRFDFFDDEFNYLPITQHYLNSSKKITKPEGFDLMKHLAKKLSQDFPHVRVDFYDVNGKIYFGELTFYHFSGFENFVPEEFDKVLGDYLNI